MLKPVTPSRLTGLRPATFVGSGSPSLLHVAGLKPASLAPTSFFLRSRTRMLNPKIQTPVCNCNTDSS